MPVSLDTIDWSTTSATTTGFIIPELHDINAAFATLSTATNTVAVQIDTAWRNALTWSTTSSSATGITGTVTLHGRPRWMAPRTAEQIVGDGAWERARDERRAQAVQRQAEQEQRRLVARTRARDLLCSLLTAEQALDYTEHRTFEVVGSAGNRYRIRPGSMGNVDYLHDGEVVGVLCAHPELWDGEGYLPDADVAVAQMLALTTDEAAFVRRANLHRGTRPRLAA